MSVTFQNESAIKDAFADVHSDKSELDWALLTYEGENSNTLKLLGSGAGGLSELVSHLDDKIVAYGVLRVQEKFDDSNIIRFIFIKWVGTGIQRMLKARMGTHFGSIKEIVGAYHCDIEADNKKDLAENVVRDVVRKNAGIASRVLDKTQSTPTGVTTAQYKSPASARSPSSVNATPAGVPKESASVTFSGRSDIEAAIKDVRSDSTDTNWVLATYDGPNSNNIILLGSGQGGAQELISHLTEDIVAYGLVREVHRFDDSNTVKFAFINWQGEKINRMLRARLGTHSGAVKELFQPYHVDLHAEKSAEISASIVSGLIKTNMGTATRVRDA